MREGERVREEAEEEENPPGVHPGSQLLRLLPRLLPLLSVPLGLRGDGAVQHDVHNVFLQGQMLLQGTKQTLFKPNTKRGFRNQTVSC